MTVEEVKKFAKDTFGKDLTDEQARELLNEAVKSTAAKGELCDEALKEVSGGTALDGLKNMFKDDDVVKKFLDSLE